MSSAFLRGEFLHPGKVRLIASIEKREPRLHLLCQPARFSRKLEADGFHACNCVSGRRKRSRLQLLLSRGAAFFPARPRAFSARLGDRAAQTVNKSSEVERRKIAFMVRHIRIMVAQRFPAAAKYGCVSQTSSQSNEPRAVRFCPNSPVTSMNAEVQAFLRSSPTVRTQAPIQKQTEQSLNGWKHPLSGAVTLKEIKSTPNFLAN